ncbi:T9SS type A sorting domain-containing protein [Lewinella sp. JB7]|uniref:T9SS type A sorting domain-containing protein n=1 Tax=Lewinella sp. JB7 TaxID=2962887 RepID=UPI0020C9494E|nr:T9SS type A sorting domain-containing protein [Lewinella sp. JB7]MCP9235105.1 T9SS type A sorting domain-containing protein [Lewinella sp. JB7]
MHLQLHCSGGRLLTTTVIFLVCCLTGSASGLAQSHSPLIAGLLVADSYAVMPIHEDPSFELSYDALSGRDRVETWLDDTWSLESLRIELRDAAGQRVHREIIMNGNHLLLFTRKLPPGTYTVKLRDGKRAATDILVVL